MSFEIVRSNPLSKTDFILSAIDNSSQLLLSHQNTEGYWWYTLEANESIGAGFIQLMHFLGDVDGSLQSGLVRRMLSQQRSDGSWTLFYGGPGDLSTTIECYFALRLAGKSPSEEALSRARRFILSNGGLSKVRVFTRIHLAIFGILPWSACPSMPVWLMLVPPWTGFSIYEFSSWARASIVPLLLLGEKKPVVKIPFHLDELFAEPEHQREFDFPRKNKWLSLENFFIRFDKGLKLFEKLPWHPGKASAMKLAEVWTREHIDRTEDIYPAMAYGILGLKALGYPNSDPTIQKALNGLRSFQHQYRNYQLPGQPSPLLCKEGSAIGGGEVDRESTPPNLPLQRGGVHLDPSEFIHQQACISPHWDTPWAGLALLEAGLPPSDPHLQKATHYLISREIKDFRGDWSVKNPEGPSGGWAFEFQNDYFPDLDDTLVALNFLRQVNLPPTQTSGPIVRALAWILSMQSQNGGWAAFDKDNTSDWVNRIPFSDHGACLDPPTPDITGRMIETLSFFGYTKDSRVIRRAITFLKKTQEPCGAWRGRWAVNFIHGTWCALQGFQAIGWNMHETFLQKAVGWLKSLQNKDGGWGESCRSDEQNRYVPLDVSTASQTAWGLLGLIAAGEGLSPSAKRAAQWLVKNQRPDGGWDEPYFTGTGFPGHFYIRYHGYRHYFPLLALARYARENRIN